MHWLVEDAYPGDNLFFYCKCDSATPQFMEINSIPSVAGHGEQVVDQDGDEDDGMDESASVLGLPVVTQLITRFPGILPVDHRGDVDQDIVDDVLIISQLPPK